MRKRLIPTKNVIESRLEDKKLEQLNRARLDALGYVLQASHWLDEVVESARGIEKAMANAEALLRKREAALKKADTAFHSYLQSRP